MLDELQKKLDTLAPEIRHRLLQSNELGKVPKVVFGQDYKQVRTTEFISHISKLKVDHDPPIGNIILEEITLKTNVLNFDREEVMNKVNFHFDRQ